MRRPAVLLVLLAALLASCAAPEFRLDARISRGEVREYRLVADAEVDVRAAGASSSERTRLEATTTVAFEGTTATGTLLLLTITPSRLTRDGERADPPAPQRVRLEVAGGRVIRIEDVEGSQPLDVAVVEDLVPLIGPPLPPGRVHVGDRWTRSPASTQTVAPGVQEARLAALRVVGGYDCAVVALSTRRPVVRRRTIGGQTLQLEGIEYAAGEIAFAFREGLPVTLRSNGEARLAVSGAAAAGGAVVIRTVTTLTLVRRSGAPTRS